MRAKLLAFVFDDAGATAIEYGLIAGLLGLGVLGGVQLLGDTLDTFYSNTATAVSEVLAQ